MDSNDRIESPEYALKQKLKEFHSLGEKATFLLLNANYSLYRATRFLGYGNNYNPVRRAVLAFARGYSEEEEHQSYLNKDEEEDLVRIIKTKTPRMRPRDIVWMVRIGTFLFFHSNDDDEALVDHSLHCICRHMRLHRLER